MPACALRISPECPEGDAFPVGQTTPLTPGHQAGAGVDVGKEFGDDPTLAHAGLPDDRDELWRLGRHALLEYSLEDRKIDLPADERRVVGADEVGAKP